MRRRTILRTRCARGDLCFLGFLVLAMTFSDCLLTLRGCYRASADQAAGDEFGAHDGTLLVGRVHER